MNELKPTQETEFVFRRLSESLHLFGREVTGYYWLAFLIPVLVVGLVYVVWMYVRDSRSVGGVWATFLGLLRCAVYVLLAGVFLLPAWQTWESSVTRSRVVLLLDVSGSTGTRDDLPTEAMPLDKLLSRQDKVIRFLTDDQVAFLKRLKEKNPVSAYRFGGQLDEEFQVFEGDRQWTAAEWGAWLKPDPKQEVPADLPDEERAKLRKKVELQALLVNGTNLGESLLSVLNRERNNMVQGIVVISDGRSTQFSAQTFLEIQAQAQREKVPIFTVGVGEHRQPINIRLAELMVPDQARPDDRFPVRAELDGEGLADQEVEVTLDLFPPKSDPKKDKPALQVTKKATFNHDSTPPHAQVEFPIEASELPESLRDPSAAGKPELEEGEWKFVVRAPRDRREVFLGKEHRTDPASVNVVKKPMRVLLFAGGPTHDFQFARALFAREVDRRRGELSVCLQTAQPGTVQDVPAERLLARFPTSLAAPGEKVEDRFDNLNEYDVVIAFDPDWTQVPPETLSQLERWVEAGGGLILVAGPVNTFQLARGANYEKVKTLLDLCPVILDDSRVQGLGIERSTTEPWRLNFPGATGEMEFLKLDEERAEPLAGWEEFFTGGQKAEGGKEVLRHGFYDYYPVKDRKPSATVIATFADPRARLSDGREQPYLASAPYKRGKVVYLGSGETWRLRQSHEAYHERFWTKLARFAGAGHSASQRNPSNVYMARDFTANTFVRLEAQLLGGDLRPVPRTERPRVKLKPPPGVTVPEAELTAKPGQPGDWNGWFAGRFLVTSPGAYELQLQVPGTTDTLTRKFVVKETNPELDDTRPDFAQLRQVASEAGEVLGSRLKEEERQKLRRELERTNRSAAPDISGEDPDRLRLYFDLKGASLIPDCMVTASKTQKTRGKVEDWWDDGFTVWWRGLPYKVSYVLLGVVGLLSVEWLTRKLLRLA